MFYFKSDMPSKKAKTITNNLCNFCMKICHQELLQITQSGHTAGPCPVVHTYLDRLKDASFKQS